LTDVIAVVKIDEKAPESWGKLKNTVIFKPGSPEKRGERNNLLQMGDG